MENLTIKQRLHILLAGVVSGLAILGIVAFMFLSESAQDVKTMKENVDLIRGAQVEFQRQVQEWKNILIRGDNKKDFDKYSKALTKKHNKIQAALIVMEDRFEGNKFHPELTARLTKLRENHLIIYKAYSKQIKGVSSVFDDRVDEFDSAVRGIDRWASKEFEELALVIEELNIEISDYNVKKYGTMLLLSSLLSLLIVVVIVALTNRYMLGYNNTIKEHSGLIKSGDFTERLDENKGGDYKILSTAFNGLYETVGGLISGAQTALAQVTFSVDETDQNMKSIESMLTEQQVAITQISQALNDLVSNIEEVNASASNTMQESERMSDFAAEVNRVMEGLKIISQQMSDKLLVIDDISDQINLLALNASIEAARAGDAGRGFAVVADEVRKLANKANLATSDIKEQMSSLSSGTVDASSAVAKISESIGSVSAKSAEVSDSVNHQSSAVAEVSATVEEFSGHLDRTSVNISQTVEAMQIVSEATQDLSNKMSVFKTEK